MVCADQEAEREVFESVYFETAARIQAVLDRAHKEEQATVQAQMQAAARGTAQNVRILMEISEDG